jgi:hypothetical protein
MIHIPARQLELTRQLVHEFEEEHSRRPNTIRIGTRHPFTGAESVYGLRIVLDPGLPEAGMQVAREATKILDADGKPYTIKGKEGEK